MPDFSKMSIIEIGRYLSTLLDSMPQRPCPVFANSMSVLLAELSNRK